MLQVTGNNLALGNNNSITNYHLLTLKNNSINSSKFNKNATIDKFESNKNTSDVSFKGSKIAGISTIAGSVGTCIWLNNWIQSLGTPSNKFCAAMTGIAIFVTFLSGHLAIKK